MENYGLFRPCRPYPHVRFSGGGRGDVNAVDRPERELLGIEELTYNRIQVRIPVYVRVELRFLRFVCFLDGLPFRLGLVPVSEVCHGPRTGDRVHLSSKLR